MKPKEWVGLFVLFVLTFLSLSVLRPPARPASAEVAALLGTVVTRSPEPTATPWPTETPRLDTDPSIAAESTPTPESDATPNGSPTPTPTSTETPFPFDTRPELDRFIYVDQAAQMMYIFRRGELLREIPCSTGLPEDDKYTEAWTGEVGEYWGTFFAFDVYADDAWYLYKSLGSILVHGLPYVYQNGYKVYQDRDALGVRPASHGCIRVAPEDATWLTEWNLQGALMTISDPYLDLWRRRLAAGS